MDTFDKVLVAFIVLIVFLIGLTINEKNLITYQEIAKCEESGGIYLEGVHHRTKNGRAVRPCMRKDFFIDTIE